MHGSCSPAGDVVFWLSWILEVGPRTSQIDDDKEKNMVNRRALSIIVLALYAASLLVAQSAMAWPCSVRPKNGTHQVLNACPAKREMT